MPAVSVGPSVIKAAMDPALPSQFVRHPEQPNTVSFEMVDGIGIVATLIHCAGTYIPQHAHNYPHTSVIASGKVAVWKDSSYLGEFVSPQQIVIDAKVKHLFQALEDKTVILCVHNVSRNGEIEIFEENGIV